MSASVADGRENLLVQMIDASEARSHLQYPKSPFRNRH
jgi:hypothetical protein